MGLISSRTLWTHQLTQTDGVNEPKKKLVKIMPGEPHKRGNFADRYLYFFLKNSLVLRLLKKYYVRLKFKKRKTLCKKVVP